jgi:hypothetical protein
MGEESSQRNVMADIKQDIHSVRRKLDPIIQQAIAELSTACSSDAEIKKELHAAVERVMQQGAKKL